MGFFGSCNSFFKFFNVVFFLLWFLDGYDGFLFYCYCVVFVEWDVFFVGVDYWFGNVYLIGKFVEVYFFCLDFEENWYDFDFFCF